MASKLRTTKLFNATIVWWWCILYCIIGFGGLPDMVNGARYLPTRRSAPTSNEGFERLRELIRDILETELSSPSLSSSAHTLSSSPTANEFSDRVKTIKKKNDDMFAMAPMTKYNKLRLKDDDYDLDAAAAAAATAGDHKDYDEKTEQIQHERKQQQQQLQQQPWRFVLYNYRHGNRRSHKPIAEQQTSHELSSPSWNQQAPTAIGGGNAKLHRSKQLPHGNIANNKNDINDNNDFMNNLDWMTSSSLTSDDYDAPSLYDDDIDGHQQQKKSAGLKFDRNSVGIRPRSFREQQQRTPNSWQTI